MVDLESDFRRIPGSGFEVFSQLEESGVFTEFLTEFSNKISFAINELSFASVEALL